MAIDITKVDAKDTKIEGLNPSIPAVLPEPISVPGEVPADPVLVDDANAGAVLRKMGGDLGGALHRAASRLVKTISLPDHLYASIFGSEDRGKRVTAVEKGIRAGQINPQEVLHA